MKPTFGMKSKSQVKWNIDHKPEFKTINTQEFETKVLIIAVIMKYH